MFRHPKYYKELRKRNKLDQAISKEPATAGNQRSPGPGLEVEIIYQDLSNLKPQAKSSKPQASSAKLTKSQASSGKHQAPSTKAQA